MKLLIVEDEADLNRSLTKLLKKQQFSVDSAFDGEEALAYLEMVDYDVIILDVMMPRMDGFTFLETIRQAGRQVIVLVLTARNQLEDKVKGLDLGADDYLVKPFEFEELLARLRALLRRQHRELVSQLIQLGTVSLDVSKKLVLKNDQPIDLTAKEYEVLEYLARNKNHILTREQIRDHVWDFDYEGESNIIDVLVKNIRRKLDDDRKNSIIQTKREWAMLSEMKNKPKQGSIVFRVTLWYSLFSLALSCFCWGWSFWSLPVFPVLLVRKN